MASHIRKYIAATLFIGFVMLLNISIAITHVSAATTISFTGTIGFIEVDNGLSTYSGLNVGDTFSGSITYGDSSADASSVDIISPNLVDYIFTGTPYGGSLTTGSIFTPVVDSSVGIWDNKSMDDDSGLINNLYGLGSTTVGTIADAWFAESAGSAQYFGVSLYSLNLSTFPGTAFQVAPPTLADSDFAVFFVGEVDGFDNDIFLATGIITSISINTAPSCDIQLNQTTYIDGDSVTANVFRFANLSGTDIATEIKIWLGVPGIPPISVTNVGADGSVVLPTGTDIDFGPLPLFPVTGLPGGEYELSCRMLDPVTGELLAEDRNFFEIQTSITYSIGDTGPAGGIVFYVTDGGLHGLEAAPVDLGTAPWGCVNTSIPSAQGIDIGTGVQNTATIIAGCPEAGIAARIADDYSLNGFEDWFLPSLNESLELKARQAVVGSFPLDSYWTSSEFDADFARLMRFSSAIDFIVTTKDLLLGVRPIRAF